MKKLLLTSDGLNSPKIKKEFIKLLNKPASETKVLIMYTVRLKRHLKKFTKTRKSLVKLGIKKENIIGINISKPISKTLKKIKFDVFYSCGGNTFYILDRIKKTHFDRIIKNHVKRGKLYVGVSAGTILTQKTIEIAGIEKFGDKNDIKLKNLKSLRIINFAILPHYKKSHKKELTQFKKKVKYKIVPLKNKQAILILGNKIRKI